MARHALMLMAGISCAFAQCQTENRTARLPTTTTTPHPPGQTGALCASLPYHQEIDVNGEAMCLPTLRAIPRLENSTLNVSTGVAGVFLRIGLPFMLPRIYAENVTVSLMVDMKEE